MAQILFVSPHLDDAVLSAGGTIAALVARAHAVTVLTVFAGTYSGPLSALASEMHAKWGIEGDAPAVRASEDRAALDALGGTPIHLDFLDAIYRRDACGNWLVNRPEDTDTLGQDLRIEPGLRSAIAKALIEAIDRISPDILLGPSAVGHHLDHLLTSEAVLSASVRRAIPALFWEDIPYTLWSTRPARGFLTSLGVQLSEAFVALKVAAAQKYASQEKDLWPAGKAGWMTLREIALARSRDEGITGPIEVFSSPVGDLASAPSLDLLLPCVRPHAIRS